VINRFDKVLRISFSNDFPVGKFAKLDLILELITNKTNAIALVDDIIKISYKEIIPDDPLKRKIISGIQYQYPDRSKRIEPKEITREMLSEYGVERTLSEKSFGFPKNVIEEVRDWDIEKALQWIDSNFKGLYPKIVGDELILSLNFEENSFLETIYVLGTKKIIKAREEKRIREIESEKKKKISYLQKKLDNVKKDLEKNLHWEDLQSKASNILSNLDRIEIINNQYSLEGKVIGDLNTSPGKIANDLFEKAKKMKSALSKIEKMVSFLEAEIEKARSEQLTAPRSEKKSEEKKKKEREKTKDYIKIDFDDYTIALIGKNANSNINLLKISNPNDWWFHVRNYSGSYLILKTTKKDLKQSDIKRAAQICAHFSKGKKEKEVEVVYTQVKYLTKAKGKGNGMVFYRNEKTIFVSPEKEKDL
jgi:predicted ribosome quality control (RQC) complex YloA/Tae2 family protein